jgi:hypothetical protein
MVRFFRLMGNGFMALALTLMLVSVVATPSDVFADQASCTNCMNQCLANGGAWAPCRSRPCFLMCQGVPNCKDDATCNDGSCYWKVTAYPGPRCTKVGDTRTTGKR